MINLLLLLSCIFSKSAIDPLDGATGLDEPVGPQIEYCVNIPGEHACNFSGINSLDEIEELYDFYGSPIVLDLSTMWCGSCRSAAGDVQEITEMYEDEGLIYLTVLVENLYREDATSDDIKWWLEEFGIIDAPVISVPRSAILNNDDQTQGWFLQGWPTFYFIDSELRVTNYMRGYSKVILQQNIDEIIGQKNDN
jgi:thiol-disulfide isomerase/thioredoxin